MLKNQETKVTQELGRLRDKHEEMLLNNNVDPILIMSAEDKQKVEFLAKQEAVKEAERKLVQCL